MDRLIPVREPPLKGYYAPSSLEEAISYLAAHRGQAQVVGGGTTLLPVVLRGNSLASYLVDVSRIGALRRIRTEGNYLVLGGAVTLAQVLRAEPTIEALPILSEMAMDAATPRLRELATLAGNIVSAFGDSAVTSALIALNADAEIANLTGSQWLPVRSLLVRPGTCRINSMSEILVSLRLYMPEPGSGAALLRLRSEDTTGDSVIATHLCLDDARDLVSSLSLVIGTRGVIPQICSLTELIDGRAPTVDTVRRAASRWSVAQTIGAFMDAETRAHRVSSLAQRAFDIALERARTSVANGML
jgi:CO/xanthine dehydrogenase FAD-binding subunit